MGWILPAIKFGASVLPSLSGGAKAQGTIEAALEEIQRKRKAIAPQLQNIFSQTMKQALPIVSNQYNQGTQLNKWGADTQTGLNDWAFGQGISAKGTGLANSIAALQQGLAGAQGYLDPYADFGNNALAGLAKSVGKYGAAGKAFTNAPPREKVSMGQNPFVAYNVTAPPSTKFPEFKPQSSETGESPIDIDLIDKSAGTTSSGQNIDDAITGAEDAAGGFGGTTIPILSDIPIVGQLLDKWTSLGRNKVAASKGINVVSDYVWKDLYPAYKAGQLPKEDFRKLSNMALQDWASTLPKNVRDNSIEDQLYWFNQGYQGFKPDFEFEIAGYKPVRHA